MKKQYMIAAVLFAGQAAASAPAAQANTAPAAPAPATTKVVAPAAPANNGWNLSIFSKKAEPVAAPVEAPKVEAPKVEAPKAPEAVGFFKNLINMPGKTVDSVVTSLRTTTEKNPLRMLAAAMIFAVVAEHAAIYAYNNFVADDADEDDDLDIA